MVENTAYVYESLSTDEYHVRLLEILPGQDTDPLRIIVSHTKLSQVSGTYDALSYMWGPPQPTHQVWVGEQFIVIRENLWRSLKHHRKRHADSRIPLLWTDSICINQEDLVEKGSQVQGMDKVYSSAQRVLIWLGDVSERDRLTRQDVDFALQIYQTEFGHDYLTANSLFSEQEEFSLEEKESAERLCASALDIVNHQYWLRLWIVQEVILARGNAYIVHGSILLDSELFGIMRNVDEIGAEYTNDAFASFSELTRASKAESETAVVSDACLTSLLTRFNKQLCENLRDRVYGMLGLLDPGIPAAKIRVDYKINILSLFLQVFDLLLEERHKPNLDSEVTTISQMKLAAQTFNLHTQDIKSLLDETMQQHPELSLRFAAVSSEFRQWSDIGSLDRSLPKILIECELILPFSNTNCHLLPVTRSPPVTPQQYRLVVNHSKRTKPSRSIPRPRPSDHLHPYEPLRRQYWIYALDKELSLGLQFFARGKVQVLGYVDAVEGTDGLYKVTKLPADLQKILGRKVNDTMPLKDCTMQKGKIHISLSILVLLQLLLRPTQLPT